MTLWLRLYTEALHDPKVQRLPAKTFKGWINLLMLAKEQEGSLPDVVDIAFALRIPDKDAQSLVTELKAVGLLDETEVGLAPHNWDDRQHDSDDSAERARRYRQRHKDAKPPTDLALDDVTHHVTDDEIPHVTNHVQEKRREEQTRADTDKSRAEAVTLLRPESAATDALLESLRSLPGWPKTLALTTLLSKIHAWQTAYSGVNIPDEVRCMDSWLLSHPQRRGNVAFVENWLRKAANDAKQATSTGPREHSGSAGYGSQIRPGPGNVGRAVVYDPADPDRLKRKLESYGVAT